MVRRLQMGQYSIQVGLEKVNADHAFHVQHKVSLLIPCSSLLVRVIRDRALYSIDRAPSWCNTDQPRL